MRALLPERQNVNFAVCAPRVSLHGLQLLAATVAVAEESLHSHTRGKHLCCDEAGRRWLVLLDIALMSTMGIDIFWRTGVQVPWSVQGSLAQKLLQLEQGGSHTPQRGGG